MLATCFHHLNRAPTTQTDQEGTAKRRRIIRSCSNSEEPPFTCQVFDFSSFLARIADAAIVKLDLSEEHVVELAVALVVSLTSVLFKAARLHYPTPSFTPSFLSTTCWQLAPAPQPPPLPHPPFSPARAVHLHVL